jgi:hypothetical protein
LDLNLPAKPSIGMIQKFKFTTLIFSGILSVTFSCKPSEEGSTSQTDSDSIGNQAQKPMYSAIVPVPNSSHVLKPDKKWI